MEDNNTNTWRKIWEKRPVNLNDLSLQNCLIANGYDTKQSSLSQEKLFAIHTFINSKININETESVFEVGCGSGAFLFSWHQKGCPVGGIDFSPTLIQAAKGLIPGGDWFVAEAVDLKVFPKWDYVLSYGAFLYFSDHLYAEEVLKKMILKAEKAVGIFDIPNLKFKNETEEMRRTLNGHEYAQLYKGLDHLYFEEDWWENIAKKTGKKIEIFQTPSEHYDSLKFRYNVILR